MAEFAHENSKRRLWKINGRLKPAGMEQNGDFGDGSHGLGKDSKLYSVK